MVKNAVFLQVIILIGSLLQGLLSPLAQQKALDTAQLFSRRVVQVDLNNYQAVSQFIPAIASPALGDFGYNACGLLAPAQALVDAQSLQTGIQPGSYDYNAEIVQWMQTIRDHAIRADGAPTYQNATGIQPSDLAQALQGSGLGATEENAWSLSGMNQALAQGKVVIVDILVDQNTEAPSTQGATFAHFARVLGMDLDRQQVYIEDTLSSSGSAYWTLSLDDFMQVWAYPETQAVLKPSQIDPAITEESVTRWALVMTP